MLFEIKEFVDQLFTPLYLVRGRRPWTPGYYTAKKKVISDAIDEGLPKRESGFPAGYGRYVDERSVEYPWLFSQLNEIKGKMLDAGSALNHRFLIDRLPLNDLSLTIMTLAPEKRCFWKKSISYMFGDLRDTSFADDTFDVIASISTIEHIGLDNTLLYTGDMAKKETDALGFIPAVTEFRRIIKPGGMCLITVPFGKAGVHGWYQVFDYDLVTKVIEAFQPSQHSLEFFGYDTTGWHRSEHTEIADAEFFDVHEGKSFAPDFAAGARGVACIRLIA